MINVYWLLIIDYCLISQSQDVSFFPLTWNLPACADRFGFWNLEFIASLSSIPYFLQLTIKTRMEKQVISV